MAARNNKAQQASQQVQIGQAVQRYLRLAVLSVLAMGGVGALIWGGLWIQNPANLPLKQVEIHGDFTHLTQEDLAAAIGPVARGGFFSVDVEAVQQAAEDLPWVEQAIVRRVWPDTMEVHAIEQRAAARWGEKGLLNAKGELFVPGHLQGVPELPRLSGPDALRGRVIQVYAESVKLFGAVNQQVVKIELDERRAWRLHLASDVVLELGRDAVEQRLQRIVSVYSQLVASRQDATLQTIDLRYSNGFAVRWAVTQES